MIWLAELKSSARRFLRDDSGTAGLEFVTTSPLILGVLVFTAEYGEALRERMALDGAVQDAARFLARAPVDNATTVPAVPEISFYPQTLAEAEEIVRERLGYRPLKFQVSAVTMDAGQFRTPYYRINVRATMSVQLPLLSVFNIFREDPTDDDVIISDGENSAHDPIPLRLQMTSEQYVRWGGGSVPGDADCILADRYNGLCP